MAVRNFWATIETEGRKVETGPRSKTEPMVVALFVREKGESKPALRLECIPDDDGTLKLYIEGDKLVDIWREYSFER